MHNEKTPYEWVSASEVRDRMIDAGVGEQDLLGALSWACNRKRVIATGFTYGHVGEHRFSIPERRRTSGRLWRVFVRCDPRFDQVSPERKEGFQRIARWDDGSFTWTLDREGTDVQETWDAVLFDRPSFEIWIREIADRERDNQAQEHEIAAFITNCAATDYKSAWRLFKAALGNRAGKAATFEVVWKQIKGERGRGRPPKNPAASF